MPPPTRTSCSPATFGDSSWVYLYYLSLCVHTIPHRDGAEHATRARFGRRGLEKSVCICHTRNARGIITSAFVGSPANSWSESQQRLVCTQPASRFPSHVRCRAYPPAGSEDALESDSPRSFGGGKSGVCVRRSGGWLARVSTVMYRCVPARVLHAPAVVDRRG